MNGMTLDELTFDNRFTRELPGDPEPANYRRQVTGACYSRVTPVQVRAPRLVAHSREMAAELRLSDRSVASDGFARVFAGNAVTEGMDPFAMCYGGHQFGTWAGQLGDGRAINLGEVTGEGGRRWVLQLKGAGPTPYSRGADGLAVMRSSVREFLCSEAMYHLGVPTTRALSLVATGEEVVRDMFYDGHPANEPGAVVCRVSPSFTRFGNFEIFASRGETAVLKQLADYTVRTDFPHLGSPSPEVYLQMFDEVCRTTAEMIAHWMRVGFVHGVMNTDNMSILGLTIDYGPYGWLEGYDPGWTPNTTDAGGRRYRFGGQPQIAWWNLGQLARALVPLLDEAEPLQELLDAYPQVYEGKYREMMAGKLGLSAFDADTDPGLIEELEAVLQLVETDMTLFFRGLADLDASPDQATDEELIASVSAACYEREKLYGDPLHRTAEWLRSYLRRCARDCLPAAERRRRMNAVNPRYVLRNYLAQLAIDEAQAGEFAKVAELLEVMRRPYDEQPEREAEYAQKRPEWARHRAGCSMLSCSS